MYGVQSTARSALPLGCYGSKAAANRAAKGLTATLPPGGEAIVTNCYSAVMARFYRSPATGKVVRLAPLARPPMAPRPRATRTNGGRGLWP